METAITSTENNPIYVSPDNRNRKREEIKWIATVIVADCFTTLCTGITSPYYPKVAVHKGLKSILTGVILASVAAPQLIMFPAMNKILLYIGPKLMLQLGLFITTISTVAFGFTDKIENINVFVIACLALRIVQGVGFAFVLTSAVYIASQELPHKATLAIGLIESGSAFGYTIGGFAGGILYDNFGYAVPLVSGGILTLVALLTSLYTLNNLPHPETHSTTNDGSIQIRDDAPVHPSKYPLRIPQIFLLTVVNIIAYSVLYFIDIFCPLYTTLKLEQSTTVAGSTLFAAGLAYTVMAVIVGYLVENKNQDFLILMIGSITMVLLFSVYFIVDIVVGKVYHGLEINERLNASISNIIITSCMTGYLLGGNLGSTMYYFLDIKWSALVWVITFSILILLLMALFRRRNANSEEHQRLLSE
ncbi:Uncharacterised protein at_DN0455 [Pycnogonum litorale]